MSVFECDLFTIFFLYVTLDSEGLSYLSCIVYSKKLNLLESSGLLLEVENVCSLLTNGCCSRPSDNGFQYQPKDLHYSGKIIIVDSPSGITQYVPFRESTSDETRERLPDLSLPDLK